MAADSKKDAFEGLGGAQNTGEEDHEPGSSRKLTTAEREKKRKCQRESNARKKQKNEKTEEKVKTLEEALAYSKGQIDLLEKQMKEDRDRTSLKQANELETIREEVKKVGNSVEKQAAQVFKLWDLIERKHSAGTRECRGSTSSSTEVLEGAPNPMASAMTSNGSVMSGSFKPCQSLPDEYNQLAFNKLTELYIASEGRHAQENAALIERHAKEIAALIERHAKEMAAVRTEYGQEVVTPPLLAPPPPLLAAVRTEYGQEENEILPAPAGASPGIDYDDLFVYCNSCPAVP